MIEEEVMGVIYRGNHVKETDIDIEIHSYMREYNVIIVTLHRKKCNANRTAEFKVHEYGEVTETT